MNRTEHPALYLNPDGSLTPNHLRKLRIQADFVTEADGGTFLKFLRQSVADDRDIVLLISPDGRHYQATPRPDCICDGTKNPLQCECRLLECQRCNQRFHAIEHTCQFQLCLNDRCPHCEHVREKCRAQEIIREINQLAMWEHAEQPECSPLAEAYIQAVADTLGEGADAPFFPVTGRALDESPMLDPEANKENGVWLFTDGSKAIKSKDGLWLTTPEFANL